MRFSAVSFGGQRVLQQGCKGHARAREQAFPDGELASRGGSLCGRFYSSLGLQLTFGCRGRSLIGPNLSPNQLVEGLRVATREQRVWLSEYRHAGKNQAPSTSIKDGGMQNMTRCSLLRTAARILLTGFLGSRPRPGPRRCSCLIPLLGSSGAGVPFHW